MSDFLNNLDIQENRVDTEEAFIHYLSGFQSQRISVKHLYSMTDDEFITCGVTVMGDRKTLRSAGELYK